jgi:hypothetical protein
MPRRRKDAAGGEGTFGGGGTMLEVRPFGQKGLTISTKRSDLLHKKV